MCEKKTAVKDEHRHLTPTLHTFTHKNLKHADVESHDSQSHTVNTAEVSSISLSQPFQKEAVAELSARMQTFRYKLSL